MVKNFMIFIILFLAAANLLSAEKSKYTYDYADPKSVVNSACRMLMNADYAEMLNVTDLMEKKRTQRTIDETTNEAARDLIIKESEKIISYELIGAEDFTNETENQLMVVSVKWTLKLDTKPYIENYPDKAMEQTRNTDRKDETVIYTDYLLKKIDGKWKIISKKSK